MCPLVLFGGAHSALGVLAVKDRNIFQIMLPKEQLKREDGELNRQNAMRAAKGTVRMPCAHFVFLWRRRKASVAFWRFKP